MIKIKSKLFNIQVDLFSTEQVIYICKKMLESQKTNTIFFLNAHCFNIAQKNKEYLKAINTSKLLLNDGIGIELAFKFIGIKVIENLNGTDLIPKILGEFRKKNIYLLGAKDYVAKLAKLNLEKRYSDINIVGYHNGFFDEVEESKILCEIRDKKVDILLVGMGVPIQELWIKNNINKMGSVKICIAGGAILDFISNNVKRAPKIFIKLRLEWLFRLINEPRRLWKRYLIGNFRFIYYIISYKMKQNSLE